MNKSIVASVLAASVLGLGSAGATAQNLPNASFESLVLGDGVGRTAPDASSLVMVTHGNVSRQSFGTVAGSGLVATGTVPKVSFMAGTPLLNDSLRSSMGSRLLVDGLQFAAKVPEPSGSAMVLAGLGALGLMFRRRRLQG
ncbi:PEP-CTERM sorting domain-containing protein [Ideonella azotifigens]|uniref:Ice-binding protein C-terminal domain-containing protein n=1 Tax=Ideonella azotifigens TaxID=513160 RepID=A0ABP3UTE2_9BURK|nr:PEP-CTERM sorting domain-containing protein [Ideonella azotifigens]MCD2342067.1 PEP-CTERM sorting domain-containing protein [Ideonella azotifigens]